MVDPRRTPMGRLVLAAVIPLAVLAAPPARATMPPPSGVIPEVVREAFASGAFRLPEPPPAVDDPDGLGVSAGQAGGVWRIPVILAAYADVPLSFSAAAFESTLFDTLERTATGSVFDYYRWASRGKLTLVPEIVATVQLPNTRHYYAWNSFGLGLTNTPNNAFGAVRDALILCQVEVDWALYDRDRDGYVDMLWFIHAGAAGEASQDRDDLWSMTSMMDHWRNGEAYTTHRRVPGTVDRYMKIHRFTVLPERSAMRPGALSEVGVYAHEFGHALGLPDLYDTSALGGAANAGPGNWSLMATGGYGSNGVSPESPSHLGAWPLRFLGWDETVRPERDSTIALAGLSEANQVVELWFEGQRSAEHFLVENRQRGPKFDRTLPTEGLIVYHVDETLLGARTPHNLVNVGPEPALVLVEGDGDADLVVGRNRGDGSDPLPGALQRTFVDDESTPHLRTFAGNVTQLALADITRTGDLVRFRARVQAPDWAPPQDATSPGFDPFPSYGPAVTAAVDSRGVSHLVRSERRDGRPQIVLVSSASGWTDAFPVSASAGAAFEPTLATLPGGDLAVAWTDTRHGGSSIYFRARIGGRWSPERRLVDLPDASAPALAADARGTLHLAFLATRDAEARVHHLRFTYRSPYGRPRAVSPAGSAPSLPGVALAPDGAGYVVWSQRTPPARRGSVWFASHHPDSGLGVPVELTRGGSGEPAGLSAVVAGDGTLHVVWLTTAPGSHQLHHHRRPRQGVPSPRDTIIVSRGQPMQSPVLAIDAAAALHLVYEATTDAGLEVRYRRWRTHRGWDAESALLSGDVGGNAVHPAVLPITESHVLVTFTAHPAGAPHFMIRRRVPPTPVLDAPEAGPATVRAAAVAPNPLPRGGTLELAWPGPARGEGRADVFDLSGRRIAEVRLEASPDGWRARLGAGVTRDWAPGIYFARPRSGDGTVARWVLLP